MLKKYRFFHIQKPLELHRFLPKQMGTMNPTLFNQLKEAHFLQVFQHKAWFV
jgi:hypothetical protein